MNAAAGRFSTQTRPGFPAPDAVAQSRAVHMAYTMREILFRDGNVTEAALIAEGYTAAEIVEHGPEATRLARLGMAVEGKACDRPPEVAEKAIVAAAWIMPVMAGVEETDTAETATERRDIWRRYCTAMAANKLDPWVSQHERCLSLLSDFLATLPLLSREKNGVLSTVAGHMRKRLPN